jgi:hypothetical protein
MVNNLCLCRLKKKYLQFFHQRFSVWEMICDSRAHTVTGVIVSPVWLEGQSSIGALAPLRMSITGIINVAFETIPVRDVM